MRKYSKGKKTSFFRTYFIHAKAHSRSNGFSLVSILSSITLISMAIIAVSSIIVFQRNEVKGVKQKLTRSSLQTRILSTLKDPQKCYCQLSALSHIEANKEVSLTAGFKTGCGPTDEVIAIADKNIGAGVKLSSVKITNITQNNQLDPRLHRVSYSGDLEINYYEHLLVRLLQPIRIPLQLITNLSGQLLECVGNTNHAAEVKDEWALIDEQVRDEDGIINCLEAKAKQNKDRLAQLQTRYNYWNSIHNRSCLPSGTSYSPKPKWPGVPIGNLLNHLYKDRYS